jgi:hypothetical protein
VGEVERGEFRPAGRLRGSGTGWGRLPQVTVLRRGPGTRCTCLVVCASSFESYLAQCFRIIWFIPLQSGQITRLRRLYGCGGFGSCDVF